MQTNKSKRGLAALPLIAILALLGAALGYMFAADIAPQIALALFAALILGLLGALVTKTPSVSAPAEPLGPPPPVDAQALASSFQAALESVMDTAQTQMTQATAQMSQAVAALNQELNNNSTKLSDTLTATAGALNIDTAGIATSLGTATTDIASTLTTAANEMGSTLKTLFDQHGAELKTSLAEHASSLNNSVDGISGNYDKVNQAISSQLSQIGNELGGRLDKIAQMAGDIDGLLKSTEATNVAVQAMNSSENFRQTMDSIKTQMEQSVTALKEATKPRTFKFAENFEGAPQE